MGSPKHLIVLLSGKQGSGKSSLAADLAPLFASAGFEPVRRRFAEPLYQIHHATIAAAVQAGILPPTDKDGDLLQRLGDWGRAKDRAIWIKVLLGQVGRDIADAKRPLAILIDDARYEAEFLAFPTALRIRLECPRDVRKARTKSWRENEMHPSEVGLDAVTAFGLFDLVVRTDLATRAVIVRQIFDEATSFHVTGRPINQVRKLRLLLKPL